MENNKNKLKIEDNKKEKKKDKIKEKLKEKKINKSNRTLKYNIKNNKKNKKDKLNEKKKFFLTEFKNSNKNNINVPPKNRNNKKLVNTKSRLISYNGINSKNTLNDKNILLSSKRKSTSNISNLIISKKIRNDNNKIKNTQNMFRITNNISSYKNLKKLKKNKCTENELNNLEYELALEKDKRTYFQYYWSLLKKKQLILFTFYHQKIITLFQLKYYYF